VNIKTWASTYHATFYACYKEIDMARANKVLMSIDTILAEFCAELEPLGGRPMIQVIEDERTGGKFFECQILGSKLVQFATTDAPLDPEDQSEYRANREIVQNASAFQAMKEDAIKRRSFSNIVSEYTREFDTNSPLKIIGGQHRFQAIKLAHESGVDVRHGVKVYITLSVDQRLDVQIISNTNIAISGDLFDRMQETFAGPELRNWCQRVGLLKLDQDFADRRRRGGPISVQVARTFIANYFSGCQIDPTKFAKIATVPTLSPTGEHDPAWDKIKKSNPKLWEDTALKEAGTAFAKLVSAQRKSFEEKKPKPSPDMPEKALNTAVLAAWAFVAGALNQNAVRLARHFAIADAAGKDPLNAAELAKGRHKTDPDNYRGLGYRTDPKERGRFVELFYLQAEDGSGITARNVDVAIKRYHAKLATLDVLDAESKGASNDE
jgi:hypothetical protein